MNGQFSFSARVQGGRKIREKHISCFEFNPCKKRDKKSEFCKIDGGKQVKTFWDEVV
jgi:hypothetical protein